MSNLIVGHINISVSSAGPINDAATFLGLFGRIFITHKGKKIQINATITFLWGDKITLIQ